jgi:murein peptide amidase A
VVSRLLLTVGVLVLAIAGPAPAASAPILIGRSLEGRDITAVRVGDPNSPRKALIVGNTHGDEPYSWVVAKALEHRRGIHGVDLWIIDTINPDGLRHGTRKNARGVDPNRNFPYRWRRALARGARFYQGPRPLSEPETQAVARFLERLRPVVSIWYHQPYRYVSVPRDRPAAPLRYARIAHWPVARVRGPDYRGLVDEWQRHVVPGSDAFVVEFGADRPTAAEVQRHVRAALALVEGPVARAAPNRAARSRAAAPARPVPASTLLDRLGASATALGTSRLLPR